MKRNYFAIINHRLSLLAIAVMLVFTQSAYCGTYGGGVGTAEEPFIIETAEHMQDIGANSGDWDKHFVLMADIDLSARRQSAQLLFEIELAVF